MFAGMNGNKIAIKQGISIVIPCYNERPEVLLNTVDQVDKSLKNSHLEAYEILVVNDGSSKYDYSLLGSDPRFTLLAHMVNKGYGASLKTGILHARYAWIGITDADGTYPNTLFADFAAVADQYDMVVGARPWGDISRLRRLPKKLLTTFSSFLANDRIVDLNSGMRIFRKDLALKFWRLYPDGFSFTSTITMGCLTNGYDLHYIPIVYEKRAGKSHIKPIKDTVRFFSLVTRLTLYFNPLRVFLPLSLIFFLAATGRGVRDYILTQGLGGMALVLFFMAFQVFFFGLLAEIISKSK